MQSYSASVAELILSARVDAPAINRFTRRRAGSVKLHDNGATIWPEKL
jgi:hypothetical protein